MAAALAVRKRRTLPPVYFVAAEEAMLEETFGDAYRDYKSRVRRWL